VTDTEIVPRWEWRTFGEVGELFAGTEPDRIQDSDETYLLSLDSDASVKVRDSLMDVKQLEHVNENGLEQWRPVMKASFPLSQDDVTALLRTLACDIPTFRRESYTLAQLIADIVLPSESLTAVEVHKHREHYLPGGCMAEVSMVRTQRRQERTVAIESEDPELVIATVRALGLESRPNVCLARGLKTLVGFEATRYAVIDVGTNSVKFHVGEHRPSGEWRTVVDRAEVTRLGEGLSASGALGAEAMERTADAITGMVDEARREGAVAIAAVGTAGLRNASNSAALSDAVRERCGVGIEVISGEDEARLAYRAALAGLDIRGSSLVVFDTGGGSSQFTFGSKKKVDERFSVDVGAVRFTERFGLDGPVSEDVLQEAQDAIATDLVQLQGRPVPDAIVGMGGGVTNMAAISLRLTTYDPDLVQGTVLDRAEIDRQMALYRTMTADERRSIDGLQPNRAEVILAGACIVRTILNLLGRDAFTVSDRGLRHGLLVERFGSSIG
jgi:exopolyphosphatase/guanosine-5'-triphosphate,3'-diphosphate pyrophosphatase